MNPWLKWEQNWLNVRKVSYVFTSVTSMSRTYFHLILYYLTQMEVKGWTFNRNTDYPETANGMNAFLTLIL